MLERFGTSSKTLFGLSIFQALVVIILQAVILGTGDWSDVTKGGLGQDRQVYAVLFLCSVTYSVFFAWDALSQENIVQVFAFLFLNLLYTLYGATQVFQFRDTEKSYWKTVDYLALINVIFLALLTFVFCGISYKLYMEFGWRIYKKIGADPRVRSMYRTYQIFLMILKVNWPLITIFLIQQCAILLSPSEAEFAVSVIGIPAIIVIIWLAYWAARKENVPFFAFFLVVLLAGIAYFIFKFYRFKTHSCPKCVDDNNQPKALLFLEMFSAINAILMLFSFVFSCMVFSNFNKGLTAHIENANKAGGVGSSSNTASETGRTMNLVI